MTSAYFVDDCTVLEELLERHFEHMRTLLRQSPHVLAKVEALVLGGGYGRGEGGVLRSGDGTASDALFNDLDYFLFTNHADDAGLRAKVHELEVGGRDILGIDVDIKCLSAEDMGDPSESMMFYDLVAGHHVVLGAEDYLRARFSQVDASRIPPIEASRLLWNRGTGLYFASCHIGRREDAAFVVRNHAKFKLAAGDALLTLANLYDSSCRERYCRFRQHRPDKALGLDLAEIHAEGVAFKLGPTKGTLDWEALAEENRKLADLWSRLFLHSESVRLGTAFESPAAYVEGRDPRSPELPRWKAPLFALRDCFKYRRWLAPVWDYPRTALFRSLFCLLSGEESPGVLPSPGRFLAPLSKGNTRKTCRTATTEWESLYAFWWQRYS